MFLQITDDDIDRVENLLLPAGCGFNEERRNFIKCMESRDVVACPGSGKTTALLAKLLILASYMPFPDGRGVCVLTHTNVAIDEVRRRAGGAADALLAYPNHFGTIQSFVNRFLAMPFYRIRYGRGVHAIDNGSFYAEIERQYGRNRGLRTWIKSRGGSAATLGGYWLKSADLTVGKDLDNDISGLGRKTPTYRSIERVRQEILDRGILSYNDAYSLALNYLSQFPSVSEAIRQRFKFVFIDEMQDTDDHQMRVLDALFAGCFALVLQRLGDPNQAIYESNVNQEMHWSPTTPFLPFSDSLRYGPTIAEVLDTVRVDRTLTLKPNPNQPSLPPHILLFESGAEQTVLPAFGALIREHGLHKLEDPVFKAVGWVGKDKTDEGKACLRYYHSGYQKAFSDSSRQFETLLAYTHAMEMLLRDAPQNGGALFDMALAGMLRGLRVAGLRHPKTQRPFTAATIRSHLRQTDEWLYTTLRLAFAEWVLAFRQRKMTVEQTRDAMSAFVRTHFLDGETAELTDFLDSDSVNFEPPKKYCANTFVSDGGDVIEVGTVHSVKGETHTATLYLETFNYALDSERLLPFCLGKYPTKDAMKARHRANLKIAHVAFSRPTHLLAFACCGKHAVGQESELVNAGWVVRRI